MGAAGDHRLRRLPTHIALLRRLCVQRRSWIPAEKFEDAVAACSSAAGTAVRLRWLAYLVAGAVASASVGPWLVLVLLGCGGAELLVRHERSGPITLAAVPHSAGIGSPAWTALKVGGLSFGGGFVIDGLPAVFRTRARWQVPVRPRAQKPGAAGVPRGAGPAAIGAIIGSSFLLARELTQAWQYVLLAAAMVALLVVRRGIVGVLILAGVVGEVALAAGAHIPG